MTSESRDRDAAESVSDVATRQVWEKDLLDLVL
jgi:hypothetical protein